jgi:hypothetical protein
MGIVIEKYTREHVPAVRDFNRRLKTGGEREFEFPEREIPEWLPQLNGRRIYQEFFLAVDQGLVRGGYILKRQDFSFRGKIQPIGYYSLPLSEGLINKAYALVGTQLVLDAVRREPLLYGLGIGGLELPLPRMLKAMGWGMRAVPFYFRVARPSRFLKNIRPLRTTVVRRFALDFAAFSGLGWAAIRALQMRVSQRAKWNIVAEFSSWADELWERAKAPYGMVAVRDSSTLRILYPAENSRFTRLQVMTADGRTAGWAVTLNTQMEDNRYFGNMRVGTIADCFAAPEDAPTVIDAATAALEAAGVDLIVSNQSHDAWCAALSQGGFREGPSNFFFAASKELAAVLKPPDATFTAIHLTRGDGDGPIHL